MELNKTGNQENMEDYYYDLSDQESSLNQEIC